MNIFLPKETIYGSIASLDDKRLNKQICECTVMLGVYIKNKTGYSHHPVVVHYSNNPLFIAWYGLIACCEYYSREKKHHKYTEFFYNHFGMLHSAANSSEIDKMLNPVRFYCEGLKSDPSHIRTTENTSHLFREKLCKKWDEDKYTPTWKNRKQPEWYISHRGE